LQNILQLAIPLNASANW